MRLVTSLLSAFLMICLGLLSSSCVTVPEGPSAGTHLAFRSTPGWQDKSFFVDEGKLAQTTTENSSMVIILGEQRALLLRTDEDGNSEVVVDTQVATGTQGHSTPRGDFSIISKKLQHRSNLYGSFVDDESGAVVQGGADARSDTAPEGSHFQGASMPYWQRLTNTGVGMHIGYVPGGRAASHGCIRFPAGVMPRIYERTKDGTDVSIVQQYTFADYPEELLAAGLVEPVPEGKKVAGDDAGGGNIEDEENEPDYPVRSSHQRRFPW